MIGKELAEFLLQDDQPMFFRKFTPVNRQQNREFDKECKAATKHLINTECNFLNQLFNASDGNSYTRLFHFYGSQYKNNVEVANRLINPKYIEINESYFLDTYRPLENP
tara:strand:+ start:5629 stop:5955 length:327 start_codon:yes stop_codon:yes gene_type:complete